MTEPAQPLEVNAINYFRVVGLEIIANSQQDWRSYAKFFGNIPLYPILIPSLPWHHLKHHRVQMTCSMIGVPDISITETIITHVDKDSFTFSVWHRNDDGETNINKLIHNVEDKVSGRNLGSDMPYVQTCRQNVIGFVLSHR